MSDPWGAIVAGAGQAVMAGNDYFTSKRRDKIMKLILERRQRQQDELDAMMMDEIGTLREETPEAEREQAMGEFVGRLRDARASTATTTGARGAVSDREAAALAETSGELAERAGREADITARIDAPMRMRQNQGLRLSKLGTGMQEHTNKMASADFLDELRLARRRKNPWLDMLGEGMKAAGGAMAGGMGGGGAGGSTGYSASSASANFNPNTAYGD